MTALIEYSDLIDGILERLNPREPNGLNRCRVELANYFAAAVLMPYDAFLKEALTSKYDFAHLSLRFGVSFDPTQGGIGAFLHHVAQVSG